MSDQYSLERFRRWAANLNYENNPLGESLMAYTREWERDLFARDERINELEAQLTQVRVQYHAMRKKYLEAAGKRDMYPYD